MASITKRPNGHRWLTFKAPNGKRQTLRLGAASESQAHVFKTRVERLLVAHKLGEPPDPATVEWLTILPDALHSKLAKLGLCKPRGARTLGELVEWHYNAAVKSGRAKPSTLVNLEVAGKALIRFFGKDHRLVEMLIEPDSNAPSPVEQYSAWLHRAGKVKGGGLERSTASGHLRRCRYILDSAVARGWLPSNPFHKLRYWVTTNPDRDVYITTEEIERVIDELADPSMQLLVTLARYAALRTPSEPQLLEWSWVDWKHATLYVRAPKTEGYAGRESRIVPLCDKAYGRLEVAWDTVKVGSPIHILDRLQVTRGAIADRLEAACRRAGIVMWPKPFINMRASCEHDWMRSHPIDMVAAWTGHSPETMLRHYNRVVKEQSARHAAQALQAQNGPADDASKSEAPKVFAANAGGRLRTHMNG